MRKNDQLKPLTNRLEQGSILVPVLIVAILIVLVLMWQAGMFSSAEPSPATSNALQEDSATSPNATDAADLGDDASDSTKATEPTPRVALTPRQLEAQKVQQQAAEFTPQLQRTTTGDGIEMIPPVNSTGTMASNNFAGDEATLSAAIQSAAATLMANAGTDFSACRSAGSAEQNLECAAAEQTRVLQEAFEAHNQQRANGDSIAINHGAAIMKVFVENLQESLAPFVDAADG